MPKKLLITPDVLEMFDEGIPVREICADLDVSATTVYNILNENNREVGKNRRHDPKKEKAVVEAYERGDTVVKIATEFGLTYDALYRILAVNEIPLRRDSQGGAAFTLRADQVVNMYKEGKLLWEIIAETGFGQPKIHQILHERKVPLRRRRLKDVERRIYVERKEEETEGEATAVGPKVPRKNRSPVEAR